MIRKDYPDEGELIVGSVVKVQNYGAFVSLDEYPDREGFIHIAEIATGWVKRIRNHIKEKQKVVCKVMHVDSSKNHVDLSLKRVNEHQRREKAWTWQIPVGRSFLFQRRHQSEQHQWKGPLHLGGWRLLQAEDG